MELDDLPSDFLKWNVEHVCTWIERSVNLPECSANFRTGNVDGESLPKFTEPHLLSAVLKIEDTEHRTLISKRIQSLMNL